MKITVTQKHIDEGEYRAVAGCPVALAVAEAIGGVVKPYVRVCPSEDLLSAGNFYENRTYYQIPRSVRIFVKAFDILGRDHVNPFTFTLRKRKA
jgi:hypothetical protein